MIVERAHDGSVHWVDAAGTPPPQVLMRVASLHKVVRTAAALGNPTCVLKPASQGFPCWTVGSRFVGVVFDLTAPLRRASVCILDYCYNLFTFVSFIC